MEHQITLDEYAAGRKKTLSYSGCVCEKCLYWWSGRCPYGKCYDDYRAKTEPFDKVQEQTPRTGWSDWNKPGEQKHWCRGGIFYPATYCEHFAKYAGSTVEDCVAAPIEIFQNGFIRCALKDNITCEECIRRVEGKESRNQFDCPYMTDTGCERMITSKSLIADAIAEGEDIEMCREQCCIGCTKICGFRCGQAK